MEVVLAYENAARQVLIVQLQVRPGMQLMNTVSIFEQVLLRLQSCLSGYTTVAVAKTDKFGC